MKTFRKYPYTAPSAEVFEIDGALPLCTSPGSGDTESYGLGGSYGNGDFE